MDFFEDRYFFSIFFLNILFLTIFFFSHKFLNLFFFIFCNFFIEILSDVFCSKKVFLLKIFFFCQNLFFLKNFFSLSCNIFMELFFEFFFYQNFSSKKKLKTKKVVSKKNCIKNFLSWIKIILSLFLYKYLQVYYVYLQNLCKVSVFFHSCHILPCNCIP